MASWRLGASVIALAAMAGCAAHAPAARTPEPTHIEAQPRIVTPTEVTTEAELAARAERALMEQRWGDAAEAYRTLYAADPAGPHAADYAFDEGLALEGLQDRAGARDVFLEVARRFPAGSRARAAMLHAATLDAYLEDWTALGNIGDAMLARPDLEDVDRLVALGARGLARIELGDDVPASTAVHDGLDLADQLHYADRDVLPVAVAQLRFALGEIRRVRSEKLPLDPTSASFVDQLELRCAGLLEAQAAYAVAVRSVDTHWAAMAGYRVGELYRALHRDLMAIPPPSSSKTEHQKQVFYAFMHVRYRVLLEKGLRELLQTVALGERSGDSSSWIQRARAAADEMQIALADEKAQIAKMPFSEEEVQKAMDEMTKKVSRQAARPPSAHPQN